MLSFLTIMLRLCYILYIYFNFQICLEAYVYLSIFKLSSVTEFSMYLCQTEQFFYKKKEFCWPCKVCCSFCTGSTTGSYLQLRAANIHNRPISGSPILCPSSLITFPLHFKNIILCPSSGIRLKICGNQSSTIPMWT